MPNSASNSSLDLRLMQRALEMASAGINSTQPNPRVGCVIAQGEKIVGEGFHQVAGGPHAEREALKQAGDLARGATVYVNLEPCCHQGRTPPCTDGLLDAGVSRVVAAMRDPNPLVEGGGFEQLRAAGVELEYGLLEKEARWLNRGFISRMERRRPWVIVKTAATLDGRTADFEGKSKWITSQQARDQVQHLRASCSAVVTGIGTALADDPNMNVRLDNLDRQPLRVLLDSQLRLPLSARLISDDNNLVIFTLSNDSAKIAALTELGVEVICQSSSHTQLELADVLNELANWHCNEILLEAGQELSGAFLAAGLVDELVLFYGKSLLGNQGKSMFQFDQPLSFDQRLDYQITGVEQLQQDIRVTATSASSSAYINNVSAEN